MSSAPPMRLRGGKGSDHHTSSANSYHSDGPNGMYGHHNRYGDIEGGVGGGRSRGGGYNDANANIMEQQNNERIDLLSEQVARLKGLTIEIGYVTGSAAAPRRPRKMGEYSRVSTGSSISCLSCAGTRSGSRTVCWTTWGTPSTTRATCSATA